MNKKVITGILVIIMLLLVGGIVFMVLRNGAGTGLGIRMGDQTSIAGKYEIESMGGDSSNNLAAEDIALMQSMDLNITLDVHDDGTAVLDFFGEPMDATYDLETMTIAFDEQEWPLRIEDGKLIIEQNDADMVFVPINK